VGRFAVVAMVGGSLQWFLQTIANDSKQLQTISNCPLL
jgi:hypothetical protein